MGAKQREREDRLAEEHLFLAQWVNHFNYERERFHTWPEWKRLFGVGGEQPKEDIAEEFRRAMASYQQFFGGGGGGGDVNLPT